MRRTGFIVKHVWCCSVLVLLAVPLSAWAQPGATFDAGAYVARLWTSYDGLPQNSGNVLLQSRNGYLWIGTDNGVARFDGMRFDPLHLPDSNLPSNLIYALAEDHDGALWIGTDGGGLLRYQDGVFTTYTTAQGLPSNTVLALLPTAQGTLWVGTTKGLTRIWKGSTEVFGTTDGLPSDWINALHLARDSTLWIGTSEGLARFHGASLQPIPMPLPGPARHITALTGSPDGNLWIGTHDGLLYYNRDTFTRYTTQHGLSNAYVKTLLADPHGALWIGTDAERIDRFAHGEGFSHLPTGQPGHEGRAVSLLQDREGNLWVGTFGYGLLRYRRKLITHLTESDGLAANLVRPLYEDQRGHVWIGARGVLHRLRTDTLDTFTQANGVPPGTIYSITEDRDGVLWIGTDKGIAHFEAGRFITPAALQKVGWVLALFVDRQNRVWMGTQRQGLFRLADDSLTQFTAEDGLPDAPIRALLEDHDGVLWVGTDAGLARPEADQFVIAALQDENVLSILQDPAALATLWVGTGQGFYQQRQGAFERVYPDWLRVDDGQGYLWMVTGSGLLRISKQDLHAVAEGQQHTVSRSHYGPEVGFEGEGNAGFQPAALRSRDGRLWFPTTRGVAIVDPSTLLPELVPPPVVLESTMADGEPLPVEAATVPAGTRRLTFQYTGLSLAAPEKVQFRHRLEGFDEEWIEAGTQRTATYTNVPPGNYTFRVRAANSDGVWNEEGARLQLSVRAHFYQTRLFYVLCGLGCVMLGLGLYGLRTRQLRRQERLLRQQVRERTQALAQAKAKTEAALHESMQARAVAAAQAKQLRTLDTAKNRFFANLSHEFRTPLTLILGPLNHLLADETLPEPARRSLQTAQTQATRLLDLIRQLLDLSRLDAGKMPFTPQDDDLVALVKRVTASFHTLAEQQQIHLLFDTELKTLPARFDAEKLERVFYNLLSNALKFTTAHGKVAVTVGYEASSHEAVVTVQDTGCGIAADDLPHLFDRFYQADASSTRSHDGTGIGLGLAKELVLLHGGSIDVASQPGFGTAFIVRLPAKEPQTPAQDREFERSDAQQTTLLDPPALPQVPASDDAAATRLSPPGAPTLLVVEDHAAMRAFIAETLAEDFAVVTAADGAAALEIMPTAQPDLVLTDVMMPRMNGYDLCRALKARAEWQDIPVVLLTAKASEASELMGLGTGADDYIVKPFHAEVLRARLVALIEGRRHLRQRYSQQITLQPTDVVLEAEDAVFLETAREVIEAHLGDTTFSVEHLADALHISPRHLQRRLLALTEETPSEFIRAMRLQRAAQMLQQRSGTVSEVAYAVGFSTASHFSKCFKERYGVSPSAFADLG